MVHSKFVGFIGIAVPVGYSDIDSLTMVIYTTTTKVVISINSAA